jgi:hypothetical protein
VTDEQNPVTEPEEPASSEAPSSEPTPPEDRPRRRTWWIWAVGVAVIVVVVSVAVTALVVGVRFAGANSDARGAHVDAVRACGELETRLNRLVPPGATRDPKQRAAAVRAENSAVTPFLAELDAMPRGWLGRRSFDRHSEDYLSAWRRLVDARSAYADALDGEASGGERAFFLMPRDRDGDPIGTMLERSRLERCDAAVRRLTRPDL